MKVSRSFTQYARYASFNVLGMVGLSCYILADTFFVAQGLGSNGLTALNLAIPVYNLIHGTGLMLGMGGATQYSIAMGRKETDRLHQIFTHTLLLGAVLAVIFVLTGLLLSQPIAQLLGADHTVLPMTEIYLRTLLLFAPAFLLNDIILCFVRNDSNPQLAMAAMVTGSLSNVVLDYLFIFPLGMGMFGAVFATGLAPIISLCVLSLHFFRQKNGFHPVRPKLSGAIAGKVFSLGFPSLVTEFSSGIVIILFNTLLLSLAGNTAVAAYGVVANLSLVILAVFTGVAQGTQPLLSSAFGLKHFTQLKLFLRYALITVLILSAIFYLFILWQPDLIVSWFNSEQNQQLQETARQGLLLYFIGIFFAGINILLSIFFTSTEQSLPGQVVSLLRGLFLIVPAALLLSTWLGVPGIWLSFPAAELLTLLVGGWLYLRQSKKQQSKA